MFTDRVEVELHAGKGGNGVVAWRREKYIPKGGPTGGNGGKGGSVYLQADHHFYGLDWFRNRRILKAENGQQGGSNSMQGRKGVDLVLRVPMGTLVKDPATGEVIADLTEDGEKLLICGGGGGGRGNETYKSPTNRAPNTCTPGKPGELKRIELELKLIADVGLVGFPNAGKSTLMTAMTRNRVKAAAYPFTTLKPNLGFFKKEDQTRVLIADIPGIIEGASRNKGLGLEFLRHVERTKLLLFVLDASAIDQRDPIDDFNVLKDEIRAYKPEILEKPYLVILNKLDDPESTEHVFKFREEVSVPEGAYFEISAINGDGVPELMHAIANAVT